MARGHKLVTKALERELAKVPVYSKEGNIAEARVVIKFFNPYQNIVWYVIEGELREDGDWEFFNLYVNEATGEQELGYCTLSQLESMTKMNGRLPLVERDCYFGTHKLGEFLKS
jgi:hypothetical protein